MSVQVSGTFYVTAVVDGENAIEYRIKTNIAAIKMDPNNIQSVAASFNFVKANGSVETPLSVYPRLRIYDKAGSVLLDNKITSASTGYSYLIPQDSYGTASSLNMTIYSDNTHINQLATVTLNIVRETPQLIGVDGEWNDGLEFNNGNYILIDDIIYVWSNPIPGNSSIPPLNDIQNNPTTTSWKAYEYWPLIGTRYLIARLGLIGSAVFYDEFMFSQDGVDLNGNASTAYQNFEASTFIPNILLNFLTGAGHLSAGNFSWDEYGRTYRKSKDIIVWRDLLAEFGVEETEHNLNLKKGTYFDFSGWTKAIINLPDPALHQGLELEFRGPIATTRVPRDWPTFKSAGFAMMGWNSTESDYVTCSSVISYISGSSRAHITSQKVNNVWTWVADSNFTIVS
jgi:hypothetical protein